MNVTTAAVGRLGTVTPTLTGQTPDDARRRAGSAGRWRALGRKVLAWPPPVELEVGPELPQKFGDHYRWPDGTWHHCC